ncbi:recombinase family protein [Mycobacterium sp. UM_Kg1]|uniref:recombinase family protein n=1 Tax=Mycobacterium sp. UM_Kg1 TaxID=1545691 RepID=UPI00061B3DD0|nr:recombinase family protein [Mycobacterium sp. UM_Kg1]
MDGAKQQVRAGCYLRISSDPRDKRAGVARQREDTAALCELKGWAVAELYCDNDVSASRGKARPEWDRLLADIKAGRIDAIAAWDQDRGWRMMRELEELREFFAAVGRPILLATTGQGDIDLSSPTGVMMAQVKTAVSEHEIAMMRVRQLRAAKQRAESGRPKWRQAFGYLPYEGRKEDDTGEREINPQTGPLVAEAYRAILAGASLIDVANLFNDAGAHGLNGTPWNRSTVSLFLRSPRNAGLRAHRGEIIGIGTWPALVSEPLWRAVQNVMDAPGRKPGRKAVRRHLLTGVLGCGNCGHHLSGSWVMQPTGGQPGRLKSGGVRRRSDEKAHSIAYSCKKCRRCGIRAHHVEPLVRGLVADRLARPDAVDLLKSTEHDEAEAAQFRIQRQTLLVRLDEIADERADGLIDGAGYRRMTERINEQLGDLDRQQQDAERVRVFDGLPLGRPEVRAAVADLSPDRFRAVIGVLMVLSVAPVGKRGRVFDPERVKVEWLQ